ncbi:glutathione-dependent formaldehyde-activating enzyme [Colletotrichum tofieldiae]|nr:glutathione-dependent formaldehyde-activating enzyme [Colletotrichum tofieldiae]
MDGIRTLPNADIHHRRGCLCGAVRYRIGAKPANARNAAAPRAPSSCPSPADRCFCAACGSFLFWRSDDEATLDPAVGCVDLEFLFGEERRAGGAGTGTTRNEGSGRSRASRTGMLRGRKMEGDTRHGVVLYED